MIHVPEAEGPGGLLHVKEAWGEAGGSRGVEAPKTGAVRPLPTQFQPRSLGHATLLVQHSSVRERLQERALHSGERQGRASMSWAG